MPVICSIERQEDQKFKFISTYIVNKRDPGLSTKTESQVLLSKEGIVALVWLFLRRAHWAQAITVAGFEEWDVCV